MQVQPLNNQVFWRQFLPKLSNGHPGNGRWRSRVGPLPLEAVPGPAWDLEAIGDVGGGLLVTGHGYGGGPGEIVVQNFSQRGVFCKSDIGEGLVKAGDGAAVHFVVLAVAAVHFDDECFVTEGIGICGGAAEGFGPICGEALDMLGVKTVAEGMSDDLVGHYPPVPGVGKSSQALVAARRFVDSLHAHMMTTGRSVCKTMSER